MISVYQHLAATFTTIQTVHGDGKAYEHARFSKPDESQAEAIKRWRAAERRRAAADGYRFPSFEPGITTTANYVALFNLMAPHVLPIAHSSRLKQPAPFYVGPEVVEESEASA